MLELTADTRIDLARSSARHGAGLFETIRIRQGRALRLEAHLTRLAHGAAFLGMDVPPEPYLLEAFLDLHTNCVSLASGVLRLLAVDQSLMLSLAPWEANRPRRIDIGISQRVVRRSCNPLNRFKTMAYLENLLLTREAEDRALFEAIALNEAGRLTDGGRTSLFLVAGDAVLTPAAESGALPGIARSLLLSSGLAKEADLYAEDLNASEAVFLTNALHGVIPVHGIEGGQPKAVQHPALRACAELLERV
jgi:branched-subunit amino acid aminotransferase/4-amino-4-deoxychorismate lyase